MSLFVLFENASGYAILSIKEFEDVGNELESIQKAIGDYARFSNIAKLQAFRPFVSAENALENINAISEGMLPDLLKDFVELTFPNKSNVVLGVGEEKLAVAIQDKTGVKCQKNKKVTELIRGIRQHFHKFIKDLNESDIDKAQLGLGHSYSRSKVKFNVNKVDNMVIQSISLLDQLEKDLNTFCMRVREWYSWHFPELYKLVPDNYKFARLVKLIGNRLTLTEEKSNDITEITEDQLLTKQIFEAASSSMGQEISEIDLINIEIFAKKVIELSEYKINLQGYLKKKVTDIAPNLTSLIGELVSARLISHAGSLTTLAKYPASTVQILGAEKALFRALKTRGNTPKYGLIYHSSFIGKAPPKHKGRISRYLANKCSLASRIDCFTETSDNTFGELFKEQVEERLKFYETGAVPRKNEEVIQKGVAEFKEKHGDDMKDEENQKGSSKKRSRDSDVKQNNTESSKKKKKKEKKRKSEASTTETTTPISKQQPSTPASSSTAGDNKDASSKKKKKKERKSTGGNEAPTTPVSSNVAGDNKDSSSKKKKKKKDKKSKK